MVTRCIGEGGEGMWMNCVLLCSPSRTQTTPSMLVAAQLVERQTASLVLPIIISVAYKRAKLVVSTGHNNISKPTVDCC